MKISSKRECFLRPSMIWQDLTPSSIALTHVSIFGIIPPEITPSSIKSGTSSIFILWINESGSLGSHKTPGTSVKIINFSASTELAISPAAVSAFKFKLDPSSAIPTGDITGI